MDELMLAIIDAHDEALRARTQWSTLNSAHEGYGVLVEDFRELIAGSLVCGGAERLLVGPLPGRAGRSGTR